MTKIFDEWLESMGHMDGYQHHYQDAYDTGHEAGVASRQEEIDKLKSEIDELRKENKSLVGLVDFDTKKMDELYNAIDELQKRIGDALKELELIYFYKTQNSNNAIKILKGGQND